MTRICVTGEALVDFVPDEHGTRRWTPGGSGLNTALALARLGIATHFVGSLAQDDNGQRLVRFMQDEGIDLSAASTSPKPCPHVLVSKDADGTPHYKLHLAGSALEDAPTQWTIPPSTQHFHATSFAATLGPSGEATLSALHVLRGQMSTSFDPNIRAQVFPDRAAMLSLISERIRHADIVKVSSEDLDVLAPGILHDHVIAEWRALNVPLLIITRGAQGAVALFGSSQIQIAAPKVPVCDSIGAGDTFMGAFLTAMSDDAGLKATPHFEPHLIARWLSFANRAAALCCTRPGADPPTRQSIKAQT